MYSCKNWYKNSRLYLHKTYDYLSFQASTSRGVDSNETNQAGAGNVITSRSSDKLYHYISIPTVPVATNIGRMMTNREWLLPILLLYP